MAPFTSRPAGLRLLGLLALLALGPAAASACEPPDPRQVRDDPLVLFSDGSFTGASDDDFWAPVTGRPVRDIGGGRVGQIIQTDNCGIAETLLFVDCTTGSAIAISGLLGSTPDDPPNIRLSARALQAPHGPLALTGSTTVAEVAALARREGWQVFTDVQALAAENGRRSTFDPFYGCQIFYPGSVGAGR